MNQGRKQREREREREPRRHNGNGEKRSGSIHFIPNNAQSRVHVRAHVYKAIGKTPEKRRRECYCVFEILTAARTNEGISPKSNNHLRDPSSASHKQDTSILSLSL